MIVIQCPKCGRRMAAKESLAGHKVKCIQCRTLVTVRFINEQPTHYTTAVWLFYIILNFIVFLIWIFTKSIDPQQQEANNTFVGAIFIFLFATAWAANKLLRKFNV